MILDALSKSMRIHHLLRQARRGVKAPCGEFNRRYNLLTRQMEPFHNLVDRGARFEIVKHN